MMIIRTESPFIDKHKYKQKNKAHTHTQTYMCMLRINNTKKVVFFFFLLIEKQNSMNTHTKSKLTKRYNEDREEHN